MRFYLIFLFACSFIYGNSQPKDSIQDVLLWQITGKGITAPSYLYGTFHVLCKTDVNISPAAVDKLAACKKVFFETDLTGKPTDDINYFESLSLEKQIGKRYYRKLKTWFNNQHFVDCTLNKTHPMLASIYLDRVILHCETTSIDHTILEMAKKDSLEIGALETPSEHMSPVKKTDVWRHVQALRNTLDDVDGRFKRLRNNINLYLQGDLVRLYNQSAYTFPGRRSERSILFLDKRNALWIPVMEKAFLEQPCFFAFGCAHLLNDDGIINLLIQKGYTVSPVYYKKP